MNKEEGEVEHPTTHDSSCDIGNAIIVNTLNNIALGTTTINVSKQDDTVCLSWYRWGESRTRKESSSVGEPFLNDNDTLIVGIVAKDSHLPCPSHQYFELVKAAVNTPST